MNTSLRLRRTYQLEAEYLQDHPEDDNIHIIYYWQHRPRVSYGFDRSGEICYVFNSFARRFSRLKLNTCIPKALKKRGVKRIYRHCGFHEGGKMLHMNVHKVIADLFIDNTNMFCTQIDHLDCNIWNNAVENLERVTAEENFRREKINGCRKKNRQPVC